MWNGPHGLSSVVMLVAGLSLDIYEQLTVILSLTDETVCVHA
jgi:hypothetical protein